MPPFKSPREAKITVLEEDSLTKDKFDQIHEFAIGNLAQNYANDLNSGSIDIDDGILDINILEAEKKPSKTSST